MKASRSAGYSGSSGKVGAAGLEDAEQPDHHLGRALHAQADNSLGADAERLQVMGELVGVRLELRITQAAILEHKRNRVRRALRLRRKQRRQARLLDRMIGVVPIPQQPHPLVRLENVEAADRTLLVRHRGFEQPDEPRPKRRNGRAIKQVGPVVEPQQQPLARLHQQAERIVRGVVPAHRRKPHARDLTGKARAVNRRKPPNTTSVSNSSPRPAKLLDLSQPKMLGAPSIAIAALATHAADRTKAWPAAARCVAAAC